MYHCQSISKSTSVKLVLKASIKNDINASYSNTQDEHFVERI
jgi:hypothetical protein